MSTNDNTQNVDWDDLIGKAQKMFGACVEFVSDEEDDEWACHDSIINAAANMLNAIANADRRREETKAVQKKPSVKRA